MHWSQRTTVAWLTYSWLRINIAVCETSNLANFLQRQFNHIELRVVVGHITVATKQIRAGNFAIVIENLFTLTNRLDGLHDQGFFFLIETGLFTL